MPLVPHSIRRRARLCAIWFALVLLVPAAARAQGTGRSLDVDLSARSSGMGGASNAVFWGDGPNAWANPAMLGFLRGASFTWGEAQLVPGIADDVVHSNRRFAAGFAGFGLETSGRVLGETRLDYGTSEGTDPSGNPTGPFDSYEDIESWRFGWSLSEMVSGLARMTGTAVPAFARHADLAVGWASKDVEIHLGPASSGGHAEAKGRDFGLLLRASPWTADPDAEWPAGVDLAYAYSVLNANDERLTFINEDQASPLTRMKRNGVAGRLALGVPASLREGALLGRPLLARSLEPFVSLGVAYDWERNSAGGIDHFYDVQRMGVEIGLANVVTLRTGHVEDRIGGIDGYSWGVGLGFHVGDMFAVRYDFASVPQASGLDEARKDQGVIMTFDLAGALSRPGGR